MLDDNPFAVKTPTTARRAADETMRGVDPLTGASIQGTPASDMPQEAPMPMRGTRSGLEQSGLPASDMPGMTAIARAPLAQPSQGMAASFNPDAVQPPRYPQPTPVAPAPAALAPTGQTVISNQIPSPELMKMTANYKWAMEQAAIWENRCMNSRAEAEKYRTAYHKELAKNVPDMEQRVRRFDWEESPLDITIR